MRTSILCAALAATTAIGGFTSSTSEPTPRATDDFVIEAGEVELRDLLDRAATFLQRNYVYSAADIANSPTTTLKLQKTLTLDATGCEEVVSELAYVLGFAMIPVDEKRGIYEWVYRQGPKRMDLANRPFHMSPDEVLRKENLYVQALVCIELSRLDPNMAMQQLRPFFTSMNSDSALRFGSAGNGLLIQGYAPQVASAVKILRQLDEPSAGAPDWQSTVEQRLEALESGK